MANDFRITEDATVLSILEDRIKLHPNQLALIMGGERVTYKDFGNRVTKIVSAFVEIGIKPGEKVAMILSTGITFPVVMFEIFKVGGVAVSVNPTLVTNEMKQILNDCDAVVVVIQEKIPGVDAVNNFSKITDELPLIRQIIVHSGDITSPEVVLLKDLEERSVERVDFPLVKPRDLAALIYSSGTTGKPKGSMHTHGNLLYLLTVDLVKTPSISQVINMVKQYGFGYFRRLLRLIGKPIKLMYTMPPFTGAGMVATVVFLLSGRISVLQKRFSREMLGTPTSTDPFLVSETQLRETVGKVQDGFELKIVDEYRNQVSTGEVGEIAIRYPSLMLGYYKAEELTLEKIDKEGWYYTGYLGSFDEDGYLRIAGRIKDMIIRAGQNIYPAGLEAVLMTHPKINHVTVVGAPDENAGEKVVAFTIPEEGVDLDQLEVLDFCRETMSPNNNPHEVNFANEFPVTPTGKVLKRI
jgi:acyl-CoA synthetase (AMP-forming)/AMP-acid ligase II